MHCFSLVHAQMPRAHERCQNKVIREDAKCRAGLPCSKRFAPEENPKPTKKEVTDVRERPRIILDTLGQRKVPTKKKKGGIRAKRDR